MSDLTERARAVLEGVTEGPWTACHAGNIHYGVSHGEYDFPTVVKANCGPGGWGNGSSRTDAEFIAASRTLVPELIAEVERLEVTIERVRRGNLLQEKIDRVRALHWPSSTRTTACDCYDGLADCPTITALDGEA